MTTNNVKILNWNANGIRRNIEEFTEYIQKEKFDVIMLTETKLKPRHNLKINNFDIHRKDRTTGDGGGVCVLINKKHSSTEINICTQSMEAVAAAVSIENTVYYCVSVYRPPSKPILEEDMELLTNIGKNNRTILGGDFNCKHIRWNSKISTAPGKLLLSHMEKAAFRVWGPIDATTFPKNSKGDVLDIYITSPKVKVIQIRTEYDINSDHLPVTLTIDQIRDTTIQTMTKTNWTATHHDALPI